VHCDGFAFGGCGCGFVFIFVSWDKEMERRLRWCRELWRRGEERRGKKLKRMEGGKELYKYREMGHVHLSTIHARARRGWIFSPRIRGGRSQARGEEAQKEGVCM